MRMKLFYHIAAYCICGIWAIITIVLFMSGEEIFILPISFITFTIFHLISSLKSHVPLLKIARSLVWYICFSLFSYLSATNPQAKPFFPLLCITISLWMLLRPLKFPDAYNTLLFSTWIFCIALVFYFDLWPIGLIAIGISLLISLVLSLKRKQTERLAQKDQQLMQETVKQDDVTNIFEPTFQVPGQQYQSLLPEYDESFGAYIQDLPSDK